MAPLPCEGLVEGLRLQPLLGVHLFEFGVLDLQIFEPSHHGRILPAVLSPPFVKRRRANPKLSADLGNRQASINPL